MPSPFLPLLLSLDSMKMSTHATFLILQEVLVGTQCCHRERSIFPNACNPAVWTPIMVIFQSENHFQGLFTNLLQALPSILKRVFDAVCVALYLLNKSVGTSEQQLILPG